MKILVTGFDPFGGETVNPAYEAVKLLPDTIGGAEIIKLEIPTVFSASGPAVEEGIRKYQPDVVLCIGQAGGRASISVEKVAINFVDARIPDNSGEQPLDEPLQADGPAAYFSTLPVKAMVQHVKDAGLPCYLSFTAGTYVCNSIMYNVLYMCEKRYPNIRAGFIHVPYACGQVIDKPSTMPSMPLETIAKSLEYAIEAIAIDRADSGESAGELH
ncbi:MAG TPA: pyroglutamyl-peptidase I [Candidatus Lachnoclostridium stercorigallinarum]|uniref:Pyrrolidone-carboxylate peptidase n=1 Tax=Candidatus Lachnoclostridium stercorigallinarum TaxID=2838634 RepID=A0A9D2GGG7_9FIRM|nr:pyroglutamyl-peptidase I [Candidatus Lachnoclostridium stercorigallinarum]